MQEGNYKHAVFSLFPERDLMLACVLKKLPCLCAIYDTCTFHVKQAHDEAKTSVKRAVKMFSAASKQLVTSRSAHAKAVSR